MPSLADQFCSNIHDAGISAAAFDPQSGTIATADESGVVAIQRHGESSPGLVFCPGMSVGSALCLIQGGSLVGVGDLEGTIGVYRTDDGCPVFQEIREGARGRVRAMKGVAINPEGTRCVAIAADGLLRMWDLTQGEREVAWRGFGGSTVEFDPRGERLLCLDNQGQPRLVDLMTRQGLPMDRLQFPAERAIFNHDGTHVITIGKAGVSLLRVVDGRMISSFATRGGSGLLNIVLSPDGQQAGVITNRSVHIFSLPDLTPQNSIHHGAPDTSGAAIWTTNIKVGGIDGLFHSGGKGSPGAVTLISGFGAFRGIAHGNKLSFWANNKRIWELSLNSSIKEISVDRDGTLIGILTYEGPLQVFDAPSGRMIFDGGPATYKASQLDIGGPVVVVRLANGGIRWWHLSRNQAYDLAWPLSVTLSGSGIWMGVVTPRGQVKILDPATGQDALIPPHPIADIPIKLLTFVNRRADMLVLDEDNVLGHYDLATSIRESKPALGRDVIDFNVEVDAIWGITGNQYCAVRIPENQKSTILIIEVASGNVVTELNNMHRYAWVDEESGAILEPARASSAVERDLRGREVRVLRALSDDQWISFSPTGIIEASERWSEVL